MYRIEFSTRAVKDLARLPRGDQQRVVAKLEEAAADPARFFRRLKGRQGHRLRIGDLRVIADIVVREQVSLVAMIGPRENVYQ